MKLPIKKQDKKLILGFVLGIGIVAIFIIGIIAGIKWKNSLSDKTSKTRGQLVSETKETKVFHYNKEKVNLSGLLTEKLFYGAPGYGQDPDQDEKEYCAILVLNEPIKVVASGESSFEQTYENVKELQLANEKKIPLKYYLNQKVRASGSLMAAHTGHHHTDVLLVLEKIEKQSGEKIEEKEGEVREEPLSLVEQKVIGIWVHHGGEAYPASITLSKDRKFVFTGLKSPDFMSKGNWEVDLSGQLLTLEFTDNIDYWDSFFDEKFTSYYEDIVDVKKGTRPSTTFNIYKDKYGIKEKPSINFYNWIFYLD